MASSASEAAARLAKTAQHRFPIGKKQVFLPNQVITFIRPKPKQPPNLASFVVPLRFNKLDLRDYLYHAYNVQVLKVRSFINERAPERRGNNNQGKWYRPQPQKMMVAELTKPFVWPEPVKEDARGDWDHDIWQRVEKQRKKTLAQQEAMGKSDIPLRTDMPTPEARKVLRKQAAEFLADEKQWTNDQQLDEDIWTEVDKSEVVPEEAAEVEAAAQRDEEAKGTEKR
ncbi:hypothetical protein QBC46DRAFT_376528 [Diplogelasinospora grovesii]|uniref:Large ribosomal subunit protein uL23m n=1 Tax=Diplogelasinospora grovesii TaxID=303347 RepID=A0AAN6NEY8_9PEZI|nr:hypothetical protein QBC46DRAFT_376528 [Diplogelasinospora grovesii]